MIKQLIGMVALLLLALAVSACGTGAPLLPQPTTAPTLAPAGAPTLEATPSLVVPTLGPTLAAQASPTSTTPTATSTLAPLRSPTPGATTAPVQACDNATFIADVTVPDGTRLARGQSFNKVWRLRNTGTCSWGTGYALVFAGGTAMSTVTAVAVPPTAPGATADVLVAMRAPSTLGSHTSFWRLRNAAGTRFGDTVWARINVNAPAPAPTTAAACSGTPVIASFSISPSTITAGGSATLSWGFVSNADVASIDNEIGGVATPGSITVSPTATTTYTLTALCGATSQTATVTLTVSPASATLTPTVTLTPTTAPSPSATP